MSYKPAMIKYCLIRNKKIVEGKDVILLSKKDNKYYEVREHIGLLTKIYPKISWSTEVPEVEIKFQGGKSYRIRAYIDSNIEENCFVSIYGIFTPLMNGKLEFTCKGGMTRVFETLGQAGRVNPKYIYRFGIVQLSKPEISTRYPSTLNDLEILEENILWIYSSKNLEKEQEEWKSIVQEEDTTLDFSGTTTVFINESTEIENVSDSFKNNGIQDINSQMQFINSNTYKDVQDE